MNYRENSIKDLQNELYKVLSHFADLCEGIGIEYFLIAGSLLGAMRHKGFIPWDDDIDVGMTRHDYNKLINYFSANSDMPYSLYCHQLDDECHLLFAKFVDHTEAREKMSKYFDECSNLSIDVFPYDFVKSKYSLFDSLNAFRVKYIKFVIQSKDKLKDNNYIESRLKHFFRVVLSFPFIRIDTRRLLSKTESICTNRSKKAKYKYNNFSGKYKYGKEIILSTELYPITKAQFGKDYFKVPHQAKEVLSRTYGKGWNVIPNENQRETHFG